MAESSTSSDGSENSSGSSVSFDRLPFSSSDYLRDSSSGPSLRVSPVPNADLDVENLRKSFDSLNLDPRMAESSTSSDGISCESLSLDQYVLQKHGVEWIDVRCEPVIEFLSATVSADALHDTNGSIDVYGDIRIVDLKGLKNYLIYDRDRFECPQHISSDINSLQLLDPGKVPALYVPQLVVDISNAKTGAAIAYGNKSLVMIHQSSTPEEFEKRGSISFRAPAKVEGGRLVESGGCVDMQYVAFTFGVYAHVEMFLYKDDAPESGDKTRIRKQKDGEIGEAEDEDEDDDDEQQSGVEVFGVISAKCNTMLLPDDDYVNPLFCVVRDEHEWVGLGTEIELSKSLVAVPAYSVLEISVDLRSYENDEFIVQGSAYYSPDNHGGGWKVIQGVNGFYVRVVVRWREPSLLNTPWRIEDTIEGFRSLPHVPDWYASHLLEVFSMFISRPNDEEVNLYGTVSIFGGQGLCNIFERAPHEAYFLGRGCNLLPLQGPTRGVRPGDIFSITVDITDIGGRVNIRGCAGCSPGIAERQRPWYDRRLCSIVRVFNERSFAALHYSLFSFAVEAVLAVHFVFKSGTSAQIYGNIIACYDKFSYSTSYDKDFFRTVLFTRKEENSIEVEENLELLKNLVAVPITCSLVAEVDLSLQNSDGTHRVKEAVAFRIGDSCRAIESEMVDISIDVEWKRN